MVNERRRQWEEHKQEGSNGLADKQKVQGRIKRRRRGKREKGESKAGRCKGRHDRTSNDGRCDAMRCDGGGWVVAPISGWVCQKPRVTGEGKDRKEGDEVSGRGENIGRCGAPRCFTSSLVLSLAGAGVALRCRLSASASASAASWLPDVTT
jgi:hypothetical protein